MLLLEELFLLVDVCLNLVDQFADGKLRFLHNVLHRMFQLLDILWALHRHCVFLVHVLDENYLPVYFLRSAQYVHVEKLMWLQVIVQRHIVREVKLQQLVHDVPAIVTTWPL